jgi:hypothetical protein
MAKGSKGFGDEKANMQEKHVKGRTAGVEDTYGGKDKRLPGPHGRVAERTVDTTRMDQSDSGSLHSELTDAARSMYQDAVKGRGDKHGDKALTER